MGLNCVHQPQGFHALSNPARRGVLQPSEKVSPALTKTAKPQESGCSPQQQLTVSRAALNLIGALANPVMQPWSGLYLWI